MNRKTADRIIVKSNARMKMVLDWYYENKHWLDREPFLAPMESGVVELQGEQIEFTFENVRGVVELRFIQRSSRTFRRPLFSTTSRSRWTLPTAG